MRKMPAWAMKECGGSVGRRGLDGRIAKADGGPLTATTRNALPTKEFALPASRGYPINDANHARDALSRVSGNGTPEEKATVRAAVAKKYPGIEQSKGKK